MFGNHKNHTSGNGERIQVDATMEGDVARVAESVADYLNDPTDSGRQWLLATLEKLDDRTSVSDAYEGSVVGSGAVGYASKGEVLGETSVGSVVDDVPSAEVNAQIRLVIAAKDEVRGPTPDTFAALQSARAALAAINDHGTVGD